MKVNHIFTFIDISKWICSGDEIKFWKVLLCLFYLEKLLEIFFTVFNKTFHVLNEKKNSNKLTLSSFSVRTIYSFHKRKKNCYCSSIFVSETQSDIQCYYHCSLLHFRANYTLVWFFLCWFNEEAGSIFDLSEKLAQKGHNRK
jgi:hypothetical protein